MHQSTQQTLALPSLNPLLLGIGLALLLFAVIYVPHQERFAWGQSTPA